MSQDSSPTTPSVAPSPLPQPWRIDGVDPAIQTRAIRAAAETNQPLSDWLGQAIENATRDGKKSSWPAALGGVAVGVLLTIGGGWIAGFGQRAPAPQVAATPTPAPTQVAQAPAPAPSTASAPSITAPPPSPPTPSPSSAPPAPSAPAPTETAATTPSPPPVVLPTIQMNLQALQQPLLDALADMRRRAEGGDREAAFDLSLRYIQGDGVPQDWAEATKWSRMAADKGHVQAQHNMGVLHERARITGTSDPVEAARWYRRAADQDYPLSQFNLAIMLLAPNTAQRNVPEALKLLEAAARQVPDAFITLGDIHDQGVDVPRDLARARSYYEASKSGDPRVAARLRELTPAFIERETIKEIQILLARLKYQVGTPDGRIGRRTTDAIKEFQRTAGVPDDGKVSSELLDLLRSVAPSSG